MVAIMIVVAAAVMIVTVRKIEILRKDQERYHTANLVHVQQRYNKNDY